MEETVCGIGSVRWCEYQGEEQVNVVCRDRGREGREGADEGAGQANPRDRRRRFDIRRFRRMGLDSLDAFSSPFGGGTSLWKVCVAAREECRSLMQGEMRARHAFGGEGRYSKTWGATVQPTRALRYGRRS